jgi:hypothetical protein
LTASAVRISLLRYSPALVLFAIVIADARQLTDPDLWGHVLWGRELLAHGSLPIGNPYSYSAPGYPWLRHEWLSEVLMAAMFDQFGPFGLKLLKFACAAGTICLVATAESETGAPATLQSAVLLTLALIIAPTFQFRPQLFDFVCVSAIIALLARHNWRGSAPLWIAIPLVAIWSNLHGGFFVGIVAIGLYGAATLASDIVAGHGWRRGLGIIAIAAAAAASSLCTFLIPPARETWYTLIHSLLNPMMHYTIGDWVPLITALRGAASGSVEQKYFVVVLFFFAASVVSVILTPKGADSPMLAVAAVMLATAFTAVRNVPIALIAIAPVFANHLGLLTRSRDANAAHAAAKAREVPRAGRMAMEILIAVVAIVFARYSGILKRGIDASDNPVGAINFMVTHDLTGNVLADYAWGQYVIWHGAPEMKVFIDSRYDLAYPPAVARDWFEFENNSPGGSDTLAKYPHDFVLIEKDSPAVKLMNSQRDWRLIYSDDRARLYARAHAPAARLDGVPVVGKSEPAYFP